MKRVFVDSDVVVSSLLSSTGAAFYLLQKAGVKSVISNISIKELKVVAERMGIKPESLEKLVDDRFEVVKIARSIQEIKKKFAGYVTDINDAHIVAGANAAKARYLISYNIRHFKTDRIREDLGIRIFTPALFLQYLRSQFPDY